MKKPDKKNIEDILALTSMQQGMLYHYLRDPGSDYYFEQLSLEIPGAVEFKFFQLAWNLVIQNNEMLRTVFRWDKVEYPVQVILKKHPLNARYYDCPLKHNEKEEKWIENIKAKDRNELFDLSDVPFRVTLCKINESKYVMIISNHHILYDGWSNRIILEEFFDAYNALYRGESPGKPRKTRYKEYVKWMQSRDREAEENYWKRYLMGLDSSVELSIKRSKVPGKITGVRDITVALGKEAGDQLNKFTHNHKITTATLFYCAWGMLLQRYNNSDDVLFGATMSGRNAKIQGIEEMVGLLINTIPLRIKAFPHETTIDFLYRVDDQLKTSQEFEHTPLVKIKEYIDIEPGGELFDTIVVVESYPLSDRLKIEPGQLPVNSYSIQEMTHYDLTLGIILLKEIEFIFTFQPGKFDENAMTGLANHYREIVKEIITHPDKESSRLEMITEEGKKRVLYDFNDTRREYPSNKTIYQLFAEQVKRTPDKIAAVGPGQTKYMTYMTHMTYISYRELNKKSNGVVDFLKEKGVTPDTIVGIMVERSIEMIIGVLGILKAGGAYLPIDPGYPDKRIEYMIKDSGASILLATEDTEDTEGVFSTLLPFYPSTLQCSHQHLSPAPVTSLAYIIYTSGTTGRPKGVMIEHSALMNRLYWVKERYRLNEKDVILQSASFIFDVSVCEIFRWIPAGGKLCVLPPGAEKNPGQIVAAIAKHQVTTADIVPSVLRLILEDRDSPKNYNQLSSLRWVFTGVEVVSVDLVNKFNETLNKLNKTRLINAYGPTESTVDVTYFDCSPIRKGNAEVIPIGKPMANVQIYILNRYGGIQPPGVYGELCIAGKALARGYLNQPELTAERFVSLFNRSYRSHKSYIYRTGDLGRWQVDGNIEFLGRIDNQVKIRGFRIELEEIEAQLLTFSGIKEVVVLAREDNGGNRYLCAYIVPVFPDAALSSPLKPGELRAYLAGKLPDYMIPVQFVQLEKMPLTPAGKIDRKALPIPGMKREKEYAAPGDEIEKRLVQIWSEILNIKTKEQHFLIGIDDNFFHLGGHSLNAIILASRIHKEFGVKIPLGEIFETPFIRGLATCIRERETSIYTSIEPVEKREYYPLSSAQQRLFLLEQLEDTGTAYNMSAVFSIAGETGKAQFENTLNALIARHESLRTSFHLIDEKAVQRIHDKIVIDHRSLVIGKADRKEIDRMIEDFVKPFDLSRAPLLRAGLWQLAEQEHLFLFAVHHIISDGTSIEILFDDFIRLYEGENPPLTKIQYKDFTLWQNRLLESGQTKNQENYWKGIYPDSKEIPVLNLPLDFPRPAVFCYAGDRYEFKTEPGAAVRVNDFITANGVTLYMLSMACINILLHKYSGQEDIVVGTGIMGRTHRDIHQIIGMFVNSLAPRNYPCPGKTCREFLEEVKETAIKAYENQDLQFEHLVERLNPPRDPGRSPIFDVLLVVQNFEPAQRKIKTLQFTPHPLENKTAKFDLTLFVNEIGQEILFEIEYRTALFKKATIQRMAVHFSNILRQMMAEPHLQIGELDIITPGEKQQLLNQFNETAAPYPAEKAIYQLFESQAGKSLDHIALVGQQLKYMSYKSYMSYTTHMTYCEFNKKTRQLAHRLRLSGVKPGAIVGLLVERSLEMIIGILAILAAGGAYLPMNPDYPEERIRYMLKDSGASILLATEDTEGVFSTLPPFYPSTLQCSHQHLSPAPATSIAYIIYTSGSTGKPKGVMVEQASVVNVLSAMHNEYPFRESDVYLFKTSIVFDVSVIELFAWFLGGGRLAILAAGGEKDHTRVLQAIAAQGITHINFVPSAFNAFLEGLNKSNVSKLSGLKYIFLAGEALLPGIVDKFRRFNINAALENIYGPTEGTVYASKYSLYEWENSSNRQIPIGKPLPNVRLYILDKNDHIQPLGIPGELCISGAGVARGYLNNPELTFARFPRESVAVNRSYTSYMTYISHMSYIYRTGDLARWLPDGNIEFLGRIDYQVKIRGFRIEPGEIESQILSYGHVKEAVVVSREDKTGDKYLCAYIVPAAPAAFGKTTGITELSRYLSGKLPDYMVPAYFIPLEKIPLTGSGKVDRKALPEPQLKTGDNYAPPQNEIEEKLVKIWSEILGREHQSISIHDNFFALGGHSLKATILAARIHRIFNIKISLTGIFKTPTIAGLARSIAGAEKTMHTPIQPVEKKEYYALSAAQQRFYLIQRLAPGDLGYNMPQVLYLDREVEKEKIETTFKQLIQRHESLRTGFENLQGYPLQRIHPEVEFAIEYYQSKVFPGGQGGRFFQKEPPLPPEAIIKNFIRPFDLSQAPLLRVGLVKKKDDLHLLLIDMHHIISDGTSQAVLTRDFVTIYEGKKLPLLRLQYKEFSDWQNRLTGTPEMKEHETFWLNRLKGPLPLLKLPVDFPRAETRSTEGAYHNTTLGEALTARVKAFTARTGTTLYMMLLAALTIILSRYGGQQDILVGSPIAGRYHAHLEDIIGLVIGSVIMRNFPYPQETFKDFLEQVKTNTLEAYEHQAYPYEELLKKMNRAKDPGHDLLTEVALIVQNMADPTAPQALPEGFRVHDPRNRDSSLDAYFPVVSKLEITLYAKETEQDISLTFEYRTALYKPPTIERMARRLQTLLGRVMENEEITLAEIDIISPEEKLALMGIDTRLYPLTHAQKRIYYTEKAYPGTRCNLPAFIVRYGEILDRERMEAAIQRAILKNETLWLRIVEFENLPEPYQYVAPYQPQPLEYLDFSIGKNTSEHNLGKWQEKENRKRYSFIDAPLFYIALVRFNARESGYYIKLHHIVSDGWTFFLLFRQIHRLYREMSGSKRIRSGNKPSYLDYIREEQEYLRSAQAEEDRAFWHRALLPLPQRVNLSQSPAGKHILSVSAQSEKLAIPDDIRTRIHEYCRQNQTSIYKLIFSALSIYISRAAAIDDFVIVGAGANRGIGPWKRTAGMFVSTIPIRVKVENSMTFNCFVEKLGREINFIIRNHQRYPFDLLLSELREKTGTDPGYLLNVNLIGHGDIKQSRYKIDYHFPGHEPTPLCIHINICNRDINGILELEWDYQEERFTAAEIRRMHRTLVNILTHALDNPGKKLAEIDLWDPEQREQILNEFNETIVEYRGDKIITRLFREQAEATPDRTVLVGPWQTKYRSNMTYMTYISYRELNKKSDGMARLLKQQGVQPDHIVALMVEPSIRMIEGIWAILKSGAAYLPIDPEYPAKRIEYMVKDSGASILLATEDTEGTEGVFSTLLPFYPSTLQCSHQHQSPAPVTSLAYIIYTSGSTGRPKGVAVEHRNLMTYLRAFEREFAPGPQDIVIQQASYCFDAFVEEMYPIMLKGGRLVITPKEMKRDIHLFTRYILKHQITIITCAPLLLNEINRLSAKVSISSIHTFISGGDILKVEHIDNLIKIGKVYNTYGPTEATVCAAYYRCPVGSRTQVPIGKPIFNYNIYILDKNKRLLPAGIPGEICISGPGITRGYINNPELTNKKFLQGGPGGAVFSKSAPPGRRRQKLYKTGDLGRWLLGGNIEFLGRMDDQVSIRGFRIEPGEIQTRLLEHKKLKDAVVIGRKDKVGHEYLCAYIVPKEEMKVSEIRRYLSSRLPSYMVPSYIIPIEKIPLTASGKVFRESLPGPGAIPGETRTVPRSEEERKLSGIWARVLGKDALNVPPGQTISAIDIETNFFDIGGHSLKATQMAAHIQEEFQVNISLTEIFKRPTIKGLVEFIKEVKKEIYPAIEAQEEKEYYPLSSAQRRLYITTQMETGNTSYNMPTLVNLEGKLETSKLEKAINRLIKRHESLRTSFETINENPVQRINRNVELKVESCDNEGTRGLALLSEDSHLSSGFIRPFDLSRPPLLRAGLLEIRKTLHVLMLDMHHIISDGISINIFFKELMALYKGEELEPLPFRYKDYSEWQDQQKQGESLKQQENYWHKQFGNQGEIPGLNLAADFARPTLKSIEGNRINFEPGKEETAALNALAMKEEVTLYMLLFAIYNVLLSKLSGQEDIIVGTTAAGRRHASHHQVIGMFVNTLAIRNYPAPDKLFSVFLAEVKERTLSAFDNQDYQYDDLVEQLSAQGKLTREITRNPLFDVMFALQDLEIPTLEIPGLKLTPYDDESITPTSKFDITLVGYEIGQKLWFTIEYRTALYKKETIRRFSRCIRELVAAVTREPGARIADLEIIPAEEKKQILYEFNETRADYPADKTIHRCIEEQVEQTPDNIALVGIGGIQLTYGELNKKSAQLAFLLKEKGVKPDMLVAIKLERSIEMIIGILGIMKAGGAYLPVDADYPEERIKYMLADSGIKILLTGQEIAGFYSSPAINNRLKGSPFHLHLSLAPAASLAYVIYTSGSTGKPKGVLVEHGTLFNLCSWHNRYFKVKETDRAAQYASIGFDASVWEIFPYLVSGVPLHIIDSREKYDIQAVNAYFERHHITIAFLPTPICQQFMGIENRSLRVLLTGGDKLRTYKQGSYDLYNNYGPTENTVVTTSYPVETCLDNIPIGKPIRNNRVYILSREGTNLQPIGVPGELCIAGRGLARGYLNDPELTREKFLRVFNRSYMSYKSYILYKTGDLARWCQGGNIEFLGRIDSQVKIRGSRIELGEIESQLLTHDGIKETAVITGENEAGEKYLCAYIVPNVHQPGIREIKKYLRGKLPGYMIPLYFVCLDRLPLTPAGKVDRRVLPAPAAADMRDAEEAPQLPGTEIEKHLAAAWREVLGNADIGIEDDFFEIGGDSIKAIQVSARLLKNGLKMQISDLLAHPTIKQLAQRIKTLDNSPIPDQGPVRGKVPLTPIQEWFFENRFTHAHHFNQSMMLYRETGIKEDLIRQLFANLVIHHDALRMVYRREAEGIVQWNRGQEGPLFHLEVKEIKDGPDAAAEIENAANRIQRSIDLEKGPLVRLGLFKTSRGDYLLIVIHHLVVDGVSWRILLEDIAAGYSQLEKGESIVFQAKTDSFRHWAQKLREYSQSETLLKEWEYWRAVEQAGPAILPKDFAITGEKEKNSASASDIVTMILEQKDTRALLKEVNQAYNTEINDILLTALGMAIKEWVGIEKPIINLEGHGRENIMPGIDISRTIGWFTSQYPVVLDMSRSEDISHGIKLVKETLRKIPGKGIGYGILRYLTPLGKRRGLASGQEPAIGFNYLGQFGTGEGGGAFTISPMKMGEAISPLSERTHTLNLDGIIVEGKLTMNISYNKYEYKRRTIEKFADGFRAQLLNITCHCIRKEEKELTPADMKYSKLTIEKLEELEDMVSEIDLE